VVSLFSGNFSDSTDQVTGGSSANTLAGIAISSYTVDAARGDWQYSTDTGSTWTTLGSATTTTAITLDAAVSTMLRFLPAANYNGAATALSVNLIESGGAVANGAAVDLTGATGGTTRYSSATVALNHTVDAVNDVPTIASLGGDSLAYSEGDGAVVIEQGADALVADVDSTDFDTGTLTVSFTAGSDSAEDVLAIRNQGTGAGQIGVSGADVTYAGTTIGTYAGGSGGSVPSRAMPDEVTVTVVPTTTPWESRVRSSSGSRSSTRRTRPVCPSGASASSTKGSPWSISGQPGARPVV
jgi:hypothetical protein